MQDLMKPLVLLVVLQVYTGKQALLVLPLLLVDCSGRAEALVAVAQVVMAQVVMVVMVVQVVVVQAVAAVQAAVLLLLLALVALAAMAGHWFWSFEHEAICRG